jgi:Flp pilus assembly pilin Flp
LKGLFTNLHRDQKGSVFVEMALLIIGVAFVVASHFNELGSSMGGKIDEIKSQVEQVGS